jgi:hypothetical protein
MRSYLLRGINKYSASSLARAALGAPSYGYGDLRGKREVVALAYGDGAGTLAVPLEVG